MTSGDKGLSRDKNLNEPHPKSNEYWFVCTYRCHSSTSTSIHVAAAADAGSCSRTLEQSRCLLSWDWLQPSDENIPPCCPMKRSTFQPGAKWERYSCSVWILDCFKGSRVQPLPDIALFQPFFFLIHEPSSELVCPHYPYSRRTAFTAESHEMWSFMDIIPYFLCLIFKIS